MYGKFATGNHVYGNLIGTDRTGMTALGNSVNGIILFSSANANLIGGTGAGTRNVIAANANAAGSLCDLPAKVTGDDIMISHAIVADDGARRGAADEHPASFEALSMIL